MGSDTKFLLRLAGGLCQEHPLARLGDLAEFGVQVKGPQDGGKNHQVVHVGVQLVHQLSC